MFITGCLEYEFLQVNSRCSVPGWWGLFLVLWLCSSAIEIPAPSDFLSRILLSPCTVLVDDCIPSSWGHSEGISCTSEYLLLSTKTESSVWLSHENSHDSSLNSFSNISVFTVSQPSLTKTLEKRHICSQKKSERGVGKKNIVG